MQKNITLFVNEFDPGTEGVSNTINLLFMNLRAQFNLNVMIHDISRTFRFYFSSSRISYGLIFLPFGIIFTKYLERQSTLLHICGSLTGRLYIKMLNRRPLLLTNASAIQESRVDDCRKYWHKLDKVIVECRRDKQRAIQYGIDPDKVALIYPAVDINAFSYHPPHDGFKVGFASSPISNDNIGIEKRGVTLLLSVAREMPDVEFVLLWRKKHYEALRGMLKKSRSTNISVINRILPDMNTFYGSVHCTILPARIMDDCKPCPNSIMESLSAGKPVLVSNNVGISDLISQEGCGLVFKAEVDDIIAKVNDMKCNYRKYQNRARQTAEKYFSVSRFVEQYKGIYNELIDS